MAFHIITDNVGLFWFTPSEPFVRPPSFAHSSSEVSSLSTFLFAISSDGIRKNVRRFWSSLIACLYDDNTNGSFVSGTKFEIRQEQNVGNSSIKSLIEAGVLSNGFSCDLSLLSVRFHDNRVNLTTSTLKNTIDMRRMQCPPLPLHPCALQGQPTYQEAAFSFSSWVV